MAAWINMIEAKLTPQFLRKCMILERTFKELVSQNAVQHQFEDFILHHWDIVKNMTEEKFVQFAINDKSNCFPDFIPYS